jgi:hypothetical protein
MTVAGTLRLDGRPVGGHDVLAFATDGERPELLATGTSDDDGRFSLALPDERSHVALLGKVRGDVLAPVARELEPADGDADLDASGPFALVTASIESDAGYPERLNVFFDPLAILGVPDRLAPFVNQRAPGVFEGHFAHRGVSGRELKIRLARGAWKLAGEYVVYERPMIVQPDFSNYVVDRVLAEDGEALPREGRKGFRLEAEGDTRITLVLRELDDSEL